MGPGSWRPLQNGMRCSGRGLAEPGGQGNNRLTTISRPRAPQGNRAGWPREPQSGPTLGPRCCPLWPDPLLPSRLMDSTCPSSEADKVGPTCTFCPDLLPSLSQPHPLANSRGTTSFVLREGAASPGHPRKPVSERHHLMARGHGGGPGVRVQPLEVRDRAWGMTHWLPA